MSNTVTKEILTKMLPAKLKKSISDEVVDSINKVCTDPMFAENFAQNLYSYTSILDDGRYKLTDYVTAVKYVSAKLLDKTNEEAYIIALPDRYKHMITSGYDSKKISSYVHAYNKNKLVQGIMAQTMTPSHVLNMHLYQEALNKQASLMRTAVSERVQMEAANSLLSHLKQEDSTKMEVNINTRNNDAIRSLEDSMRDLVNQQKSMIENGRMSATQVARSSLIIEGDVEDVESE